MKQQRLPKNEEAFLNSFQRDIGSRVVNAIDMNFLSINRIPDPVSRLDAYEYLIQNIYETYIDEKTKFKLSDHFSVYADSQVPAYEAGVDPKTCIGESELSPRTLRVTIELFSKTSNKKVYAYAYDIQYPNIAQ